LYSQILYKHDINVLHYVLSTIRNIIQCAAVEALKHFIPTYLVSAGEKIGNDVVSKYVALLDDPNVAARRGGALALGILPYEFLLIKWMPVMSKLCSSCTIEVVKFPLHFSSKTFITITRAVDVLLECWS
jgi:hypothetical protein